MLTAALQVLLISVPTKTLPHVAQTRPLHPLGLFSVRDDLAERTGEVPAIPDLLVPNSRLASFSQQVRGHQSDRFSTTYEKTDNAIVSAVIILVGNKSSLTFNGRIQQRRRVAEHRRRRRVLFCCCCCATFIGNRTPGENSKTRHRT